MDCIPQIHLLFGGFNLKYILYADKSSLIEPHYGFTKVLCKGKKFIKHFYAFGPPSSLRLHLLFPFHFQNVVVGNRYAEYFALFPAGVCVCVCVCVCVYARTRVRAHVCIVGHQ